MDKLVTFSGVSSTGEPLVQALFTDNGTGKVKLAHASQIDPEIQKYIDGIKSNPNKLYVLVNALGAGEYYGSNQNADYFEEKELNPEKFRGMSVTDDPDMYGFQTFHTARIHRNHRNKDPEIAYGRIAKAIYNPRMHRVELVVEIDRRKAQELGHQDLLDVLDSGGHPAVSMGSRVKYDVCAVCGNKSFTRADYCDDMKLMRNRVLPDGRQVFVYNPKPKFFELSFVIIGADKTSYAMMKVAYALEAEFGGLSVDVAERMGLTQEQDRRVLLQKMAAVQKRAAILKQVPGMASKLSVGMSGLEPDMSLQQMRGLARCPLREVLTSTCAGGMVLKPQEYQTIILIKLQRPRMAEDLLRAGRHFASEPGVDDSLSWGNRRDYRSSITQLLGDILGRRSALGPDPLMRRRRVMIKVSSPIEQNSRLLTKVAEGYNGYRIGLLEKAPSLVSSVTSGDGGLLSTLFSNALEDSFLGLEKAAGCPPNELLTETGMAILYGAHRQAESGLTKVGANAVDEFVERHPVLAASLLLGLARLGEQLVSRGKLGQLVNLGLLKLT